MYKHITIAVLTLFIVAATTLTSFWIVSKPADSNLNVGFPFTFLRQDYNNYGNGEIESEKFPTSWRFNPNLDKDRFPVSFNSNNFWLDYILFLLLLELIVELASILSNKINS